MLAAQKDPRLDAAPAVGEDPIHKQDDGPAKLCIRVTVTGP
jgi:hypothetical protein